MNDKTDFEIGNLPWGNEILPKLYEQYYEILDRHLKEYSRYHKGIYDLIKHTQIMIKYDPQLDKKGIPSKGGRGVAFWNDLVDEINEVLRNILIEDYMLSEEYVNAIEVGSLALRFLSPLSSSACSGQWESFRCSNGTYILVCCP